MKLEEQVCSLGLAKRLKELGIPQEGLAYFIRQEVGEGYDLHIFDNSKSVKKSFEMQKREIISAFTVAELGEMLPRLTNYRIWQQHSTDSSSYSGKWSITINDVKNDKYTDLKDKTEADARARMLIYLLENHLIN